MHKENLIATVQTLPVDCQHHQQDAYTTFNTLKATDQSQPLYNFNAYGLILHRNLSRMTKPSQKQGCNSGTSNQKLV